MADLRKFGSQSNLVSFKLRKADTGQGLTGLSSASTGLIISTRCDNEATATAYTVAGSTIETIATLGTFATPTATKCRFKEVDATNHPGIYEFQFANARFSVASSKRLIISVSGVTNLLESDYEIQLTQFDPYENVWDALRADHLSAGTMGAYLDSTNANAVGAYSIVNSGTYGNSALHAEVAKDSTVAKEASLGTPQTGDNYALLTNANTELTSVPNTTSSIKSMIQFLFTYFRNKKTITSTTETLMKEDAATTLGTSTISDDGTTFTKGEMS
jgi:hypothetical protein